MDVRIYYEDTDCGGVVYYANYLKYFERARTEYLEARGHSVAALMEQSTVFVVVHAEVDYRSPGRYGDTLVIETSVSDVTPASFTFSHVLREKTSGRVVVEGSARLAVTDGNGKVKRLNKAIVAALKGGPRSAERRRS
ncbi:MAG: YbgC/FadM family acyl-CoA thioesterase [Nitrospiraceae bacterium]